MDDMGCPILARNDIDADKLSQRLRSPDGAMPQGGTKRDLPNMATSKESLLGKRNIRD
jgi:hypothetical protein